MARAIGRNVRIGSGDQRVIRPVVPSWASGNHNQPARADDEAVARKKLKAIIDEIAPVYPQQQSD